MLNNEHGNQRDILPVVILRKALAKSPTQFMMYTCRRLRNAMQFLLSHQSLSPYRMYDRKKVLN